MTLLRPVARALLLGAPVLGACGAGAPSEARAPAANESAPVAPTPVASVELPKVIETPTEEPEDAPAEMGMIGLVHAGAAGSPFAPGATDAERDLPMNMWGESIGDAFGAGGLGLSGVGAGGTGPGTGLGTIGTIGLGTGAGQGFGVTGSPHRAKPPTVRPGAPSVAGGTLPKEVIQRIVRQNFGRFRLCYEQGLATQPKLAGKVTVKFVIAKAGNVASAVVDSTDLADPAVAQCVVRSFMSLSFPTPEGGQVVVKYPIAFSPGDPKAPAAASAVASASAQATPVIAARTVHGRALAEASVTDLESALVKAGFRILTSTRRGGASGPRAVADLVAEKDGVKASITFQPARVLDAVLSADEIRRVDAGGASVSEGDFYLGVVISGDRAAAEQLAHALTHG